MTGDDRLRAELRSLEEAVPVPHVPSTSSLPSRPWSRIGLIAATIVAAVAVTSLALGVGKSPEAGSQSPSPGPSGPSTAANPAARGEIRVGDFILVISSPKTVWTTEESIHVSAALAYVGPEPDMSIGQGIPPITFSLQDASGRGPVLRGLQLQPCVQHPLSDDEPLVEEFRKGVPFGSDGGYLESAPPFDRRFLDDPELHLPAGEWKFTAGTSFRERDCGPDYSLTASIVLEVGAPPSVSPRPSIPVSTEPSPEASARVTHVARKSMSFVLPSGWTYRLPDPILEWGPGPKVIYFSNQPMHHECDTTDDESGTSTTCGLPIDALAPDGVFIEWWTLAYYWSESPPPLPAGTAYELAGVDAVRGLVSPDECEHLGATEAERITLRRSSPSLDHLRVCGRDVSDETRSQVEALLQSIAFGPAPDPTPAETPFDDNPAEISGVLRGDPNLGARSARG